jgi:branched-subunit amino acid aminotransferase/4-amino-4-deoxychorismate lyase
MTASTVPSVEIDGQAPSVEQLQAIALATYGHFTAMQVRNFRTRGLDLHLRRLDAASREMFGEPVDGDHVRDLIRHALAGRTADASVRVLVQQPGGRSTVTVTVRPPHSNSDAPWRLQSVPYLRSVAHLKHIGDFGQNYYGDVARRNGYDDALLTGPDGVVAESAIANVGFFDGGTVIWPDSPLLEGITMQLLARHGLASRREGVRLADIGGYEAAFVSNSWGVFAIGEIDDLKLPARPDLMARLNDAYDSAPWDLI